MNPRGITVYDVLVKIREAVNRSISPQEIAANPAAPDYFRARTSADPREYAQGVKRIDLLGQHVFFAGLSPSRESSNCWHAHFCANV
ncbi:hypothetical protein ID866_6293 [Astraeus odoratus]|nr:hypothetical protein ID866_6293 [Astraeus odoratus]